MRGSTLSTVTGTEQVASKSGRKKTRPRSNLRWGIITQARIERCLQEIINTTDWLLRAFLTDTSIVIYHDQWRQTKSSDNFRPFEDCCSKTKRDLKTLECSIKLTAF